VLGVSDENLVVWVPKDLGVMSKNIVACDPKDLSPNLCALGGVCA